MKKWRGKERRKKTMEGGRGNEGMKKGRGKERRKKTMEGGKGGWRETERERERGLIHKLKWKPRKTSTDRQVLIVLIKPKPSHPGNYPLEGQPI